MNMNRDKRRTATTLLALSLMMGSAAVLPAEDEHAGHHPDASTAASEGKTVPAATPDAPAEAVASMKKMQAQMAAIAKTTDPKERAKLLDEHMQTMTATMQNMQKAAGGMKKMGEGCMPMQGAGGMGMMQMMMEQMMQHQKAMAPAPAK